MWTLCIWLGLLTLGSIFYACEAQGARFANGARHGLRRPGEEIAFTARPKIKSQSQIYRYGRSIFCLPHRPKISGFFDLYLHWVSVVRAFLDGYAAQSGAMAMAPNWQLSLKYVLQNELCRYIFLKESYASKTFEFIMHTLCRMVRSTMGLNLPWRYILVFIQKYHWS